DLKISEFRRARSRKYSRRYYEISDQGGSSADPPSKMVAGIARHLGGRRSSGRLDPDEEAE
ncbi:MAG: hypothetical protein WA156_14040, partial [Methylocystis silviterrae]